MKAELSVCALKLASKHRNVGAMGWGQKKGPS